MPAPVRVKTASGWQDLAIVGATGPQGPIGSQGPAGPIPIGTSLPASPADGDEYILVDSLTAPTYSWRFKYLNSITDAYKWLALGPISPVMGADPNAVLNTQTQVGASGYYYNLATSMLVPRAGIYIIEGMAMLDNVGDGNAISCSPFVGTGIAGYAYTQFLTLASGTPGPWVLQRQSLTVTPSGSRLGYGIFSNGAATKKLRFTSVKIIPLRVS